MASMTAQEVQETVDYWETLTEEQRAWVRQKCNFEQRPRPFILREYRKHIDLMRSVSDD